MIDEATDYAIQVVDGIVPACKWVRLACERHLRDLMRSDIWFDTTAASQFYRYCRKLKHYKGPMKGQAIELEPWQKFVFGCIYGWKRCEKRQINGEWKLVQTDLWRFHYIYLEVPRKNGKTTIAAAGASFDCAMMEETGAEVYCLATKEDQAKLLFNDVKAYINGSDELAEAFEILEGRGIIFSKDSSRTSFIRPLGSDSQRLDGLNPFSAYADELHAWPSRDLWDVIEDAFGARTNWHMVAITTAGHDKNGVCYQERQHLIDILEQRIDSDDKFGVIYTVDDDEKDRWMELEVWAKANPNLGCGKQVEYMESIALKAQQMPSKINAFLNKQLNIWTDVAEAWIKFEDWTACKASYSVEDLKGKRCKCAIDLARVNDLSAVAYLFPVQPGLAKPRVHVDFYHPQEGLRARMEADKVPYDLWVNKGFIKATPGTTTDFAFILHDIKDRSSFFVIEEIAYDRHFAGELVNSLKDEGFTMSEFGMGFLSMGPPTAELERRVIGKQIEHNSNPVLDWNISNVVVRRDPAGNIKPDKDASQKRIDGVVATIMALGRVIAPTEQKKKSVYERRGLRVT